MDCLRKCFGKISIVLLGLLFCVLNDVYAQVRNIEVKAEVNKKVEGQKERVVEPLASAHILGFADKKDADAFFKKLKNGDIPTTNDYSSYCDVYELTDNEGLAYVTLPLDGWIVCIPRTSDDPKLQKVANNATCRIMITGAVAERTLTTVEAKAKKKKIEFKKVKTPRVGNRITQEPTPYPIPDNLTKDNGRYGLAILFIGLEDGDTLCHWRPFIKDGKDYHNTQHRRMGYNMRDSFYIVNDTLGKFVSRYHMQSHVADTVIFSWDLMLPQGKYYRALADKWAEDYNGHFYKDTVELFDGYSPEPLRFLDFKIDSIPVDITRYEMKGKMDEHENNMSLHFNFLTGKVELADDSINQVEKEKLLAQFLPAYQDLNNSRFTVKLVGKASPEGPYATNDRLSAGRAKTIADWLSEVSGFYGANTDSYVTNWAEVADTLALMGDYEKADELRAIASKYKSIDQQNSHVRNLPYYKYLVDEICPKFRVVNFSFNYIVKRPLKRDEVIEKYEKDPAYKQLIKSGYEYMFLFDYLKDRTPELEIQSRQAYENIKEVANRPRPWPLAAYHYSRCLTKRKKPNVNILGPYFRKEYGPNRERVDENFRKQWWNDEALLVAEIEAYCASGNYGAANFIVENYLPADPKFDRLRLFLQCYDNNYTKKEVIDAVASTSLFNKAVIYAAQNEEADTANLQYLREAWRILCDTSFVSKNNSRELYLRGTIGYRIFKANPKNTKTFLDGIHFTTKREFNEEEWKAEFLKDNPEQSDYMVNMMMGYAKEEFEAQNQDESIYWGYDILHACQLDSAYLKVLKFDGYFNRAFKKAFHFFWKGLKEGKDVFEIQKQWDALEPKKKE